jgi:multidrug efflux pump subunit AcrA (membrane-fusion protein)
VGGAVLATSLALSIGYGDHGPNEAAPEALRVQGQSVSYSAGFAVQNGIRTMEVHESLFFPVVSGVGKITFDPEHLAAVAANTLGTVRRVAKYEGDSVKVGEVLAEIGSPLQAQRDAAVSLHRREVPYGVLGISEVRSPLEGRVVERRVVTGQSVRGERVVFVVANLEHLALELSLDAAQARALKVGDHVELAPDAAPEGFAADHKAEVLALSDAAGAKVAVQVRVDNRVGGLRPGQAVTVKIFSTRGARALVVPNRALVWIAGRPAVFVSDGQHSVNASAVTLGGDDGEQTEVRVGLASGQRIVSDGVPKLREASFL